MPYEMSRKEKLNEATKAIRRNVTWERDDRKGLERSDLSSTMSNTKPAKLLPPDLQ